MTSVNCPSIKSGSAFCKDASASKVSDVGIDECIMSEGVVDVVGMEALAEDVEVMTLAGKVLAENAPEDDIVELLAEDDTVELLMAEDGTVELLMPEDGTVELLKAEDGTVQ